MKNYNPGLHILSTFHGDELLLKSVATCNLFFNDLITELGLSKIGDVYHSFENGGFTAVVCLTESHVSIHTWPEFGLATFDVFLSNFYHDNTEKAKLFHERTLAFFDASDIKTMEVTR